MAQLALRDASVLVIGAGALGSPVALYLAGAGVGRLGIADDDDVEISNLHRQLLHFTPDIGVAKVESAAAKLRFLNPEIVVEPYQVRVDAANAPRAGRGAGPGDRLLGLLRDPLRRQRRLLRGRDRPRRGRRGGLERARDDDRARAARPAIAARSRPSRRTRSRAPRPACSGPAAGVIGSIQALEALKLLTGAQAPLVRRVRAGRPRHVRDDARPREPAAGLPRLRRVAFAERCWV